MRSPLAKELRKRFAAELTQSFAGFVEAKGCSVWPGDRLYVRRTPKTSYFVRLVSDSDRDRFRVMYGWSSIGEPPREQLDLTPDRERDLLAHDGYEFRIMQPFNDSGGMEDRWWVLEDASGAAFERTLEEFRLPGDTPIQAVERATSEGLTYMLSAHCETAVEELIPKIPQLVRDCVKHLRDTVIPYFEEIREMTSD